MNKEKPGDLLGWLECPQCHKDELKVGVIYADSLKGMVLDCKTCKKQMGAVELSKRSMKMMIEAFNQGMTMADE